MTEERRQILEQEREAAAAAHDEARLAAIERTIARRVRKHELSLHE